MFLSSHFKPGIILDPKGDSQLLGQISSMFAKKESSIEYIKNNFFEKNAEVSTEKLKIVLEKILSHQEYVFCVKYSELSARPRLLNSLKNGIDIMTFDFGDSEHSQSEPYTLISYELYLDNKIHEKEIIDLQVIENVDKKTQKFSYTLCLAASHESLSMVQGSTHPFYTKHFSVLEGYFDFYKYTDFLRAALNELISSFELTLQP